MTAFLGHGTDPPLDAMQQLATQANFADWRQAREIIDRVAGAIGRWDRIAADLGVRSETRRMVERRPNEVRTKNKALFTDSASGPATPTCP